MTEREKANVNTHLPEIAEGLKRVSVGDTVSVSENFLELMKNTNANFGRGRYHSDYM